MIWQTVSMICFEVSLNGRRLTTAGIPGFAVLNTILNWVNRRPRPGRAGSSELCLSVGGLDSNGPDYAGYGTFLDWVRRPLKSGDLVKVRVLERESADPPTARRSDSKAELERDRKDSNRYYLKEHLKRRKEIDTAIARLKRAVREDEKPKTKSPTRAIAVRRRRNNSKAGR